MAKRIVQVGDDQITARRSHYDELDVKLIELLLTGNTTRQCASDLKKPLSTIQRRVRLLIEKGALMPTFELGYSELEIKRGLLHVYLKDGRIEETINNLLARDGILSVGVHLGNSDLVGTFVYKESNEVLNLITSVKNLEGIDKVVWSEEVYEVSANPKLQRIFTKKKKQGTIPSYALHK